MKSAFSGAGHHDTVLSSGVGNSDERMERRRREQRAMEKMARRAVKDARQLEAERQSLSEQEERKWCDEWAKRDRREQRRREERRRGREEAEQQRAVAQQEERQARQQWQEEERRAQAE